MIELPPLPDRVPVDKHLPTGVLIYGYKADQMRAYGEACALAERARWAQALQARRETLRGAREWKAIDELRKLAGDLGAEWPPGPVGKGGGHD